MSGEEERTEKHSEERKCSDCEEQKDELMALESIFCDRSDQLHYSIKEEGLHSTIDGCVRVNLPKLEKPIIVRCNDAKGSKEIKINYMSPLRLTFDLPHDYPSSSAPRFSIYAVWITQDEREQLSSSLKDCWREYRGMPILFAWTQTLEDEAMRMLNAKSVIDLDAIHLDDSSDSEVGVQQDSGERLRFMSEYEENASQVDFEKGWYDCEVCFDSKSGKESVKFMPCGHIFCIGCVSSYYRQRLKDLTTRRLECLREGCESAATQAQLKLALAKEEFERYESLLLAGTLDLMSDVVVCPRIACGAHVLLDAEQLNGTSLTPNLGQCSLCNYTFCIICKKTYHGLDDCVFDAALREELLMKHEKASADEREALFRRYGRKKVERQIEWMQSDRWMAQNSKPCPRCRVKIEKADGCNKIHCAKCGVNFCWLCGTELGKKNPYEHFNLPGSCCFNRLFEGMEESDSEGEEDEEDDWIPFLEDNDSSDG
uniref:RBR-type E3 ubiquitin transferase n=2 Tax=Parascaris univalens TaxID=6257 RepID=A0A914ZL34_PARUN